MRKNKKAHSLICLLLVGVMLAGALPVNVQAASSSEIQKEIDALEEQNAAIQKEIDALSKQFRELDTRIQGVNWTAELLD